MDTPTQDVKQQFTYAVDQQVSVNAFIDIDIEGENVRFQITSRYNSTADKIVKTTKEAIAAFAALRVEYPRTERTPAPAQPTQTQTGEKKKFENKPVPASELPEGLPEGIECFKDEFDYFVIEPKPDNKASVKFFKDNLEFAIGAQINNWKHDSVKQHLSRLGDFDPSIADKKRISGVMYWSKGNEYIISKGAHAGEKSHYKDLRLLVPSF